MSQLDLALEAGISPKHLSFLETGRSRPSREMVLLLTEQLNVPLRERNVLLLAAGYAPAFPERPLHNGALGAARQGVELILAGHEPYPALAVDRHWTLLMANRAVSPLPVGTDPGLLQPPVNVLRLSLHLRGLAPRIANYDQWRAHLLARLRQQIGVTADVGLIALLEELRNLPAPPGTPVQAAPEPDSAAVAVPFLLRTEIGVLCFYSTTTLFAMPVDVTCRNWCWRPSFPPTRRRPRRSGG